MATGHGIGDNLAADFCVEGAVELDVSLVALDESLVVDVRGPVVHLEVEPSPRREAGHALRASGAHLDAAPEALAQAQLHVVRQRHAIPARTWRINSLPQPKRCLKKMTVRAHTRIRVRLPFL